jgi:hypothetical protein
MAAGDIINECRYYEAALRSEGNRVSINLLPRIGQLVGQTFLFDRDKQECPEDLDGLSYFRADGDVCQARNKVALSNEKGIPRNYLTSIIFSSYLIVSIVFPFSLILKRNKATLLPLTFSNFPSSS